MSISGEQQASRSLRAGTEQMTTVASKTASDRDRIPPWLPGICPLLAIGGSFSAALGIGLATCGALLAAQCVYRPLFRFLPGHLRQVALYVLIAAFVVCAFLILRALAPILHAQISGGAPVVVISCMLLAPRPPVAEDSSAPPLFAATWTGFALLPPLVLAGALREFLATSISGDTMAESSAQLHTGWAPFADAAGLPLAVSAMIGFWVAACYLIGSHFLRFPWRASE